MTSRTIRRCCTSSIFARSTISPSSTFTITGMPGIPMASRRAWSINWGGRRMLTMPPTRKLTFDGIPLAKFTQQMQTALNAKTMRVLGDPALGAASATSWGFCGREGGIKIFTQPDVDVLICGETREWELVEYCQDNIQSGNKKALIVVGHVLSEQGGMILCADWLKAFIPEVPIQFVAAAEPFWNPDHPLQG